MPCALLRMLSLLRKVLKICWRVLTDITRTLRNESAEDYPETVLTVANVPTLQLKLVRLENLLTAEVTSRVWHAVVVVPLPISAPRRADVPSQDAAAESTRMQATLHMVNIASILAVWLDFGCGQVALAHLCRLCSKIQMSLVWMPSRGTTRHVCAYERFHMAAESALGKRVTPCGPCARSVWVSLTATPCMQSAPAEAPADILLSGHAQDRFQGSQAIDARYPETHGGSSVRETAEQSLRRCRLGTVAGQGRVFALECARGGHGPHDVMRVLHVAEGREPMRVLHGT